MSRFIWFLAGANMALSNLMDAIRGPRSPMEHVDPTAWAIVFSIGALAWAYLSIQAARGDFR